ncbi:MAG TPA: TIM barrel protein [Acidimicrobiia bacterium]|nr:TIM barrel protein [Acidimicrobiia bacterium]
MKDIELHVHSFGLRFHFKHQPGFDVFRFIEVAAEQGFSGVNISANGPHFRDLGGTTPEHFENVRAKLTELSMKAELDTSGTAPAHLASMLEVAAAVGADQLRTYTRYSGNEKELIEQTVRDLLEVAPAAEELEMSILLENHEDFRGGAIAEILGRVDHPRIRALFDYGNSQMVGEDPLAALEAMAPFTTAVHMKDHVVVAHENALYVQGVVMGSGKLPVSEMTDHLYGTGLRRFCFENVWGYTAPIKVAADNLPRTEAFSLDHDHAFLNANRLAPEAAVEQEWAAFTEAWRWLRSVLEAGNYRWQRSERETFR